MPIIKPVSDLRNYPTVLQDVEIGSPVFLTKNGRGRYVLMDIDEYDKPLVDRNLLKALADGESSADENGWLTHDEDFASLAKKGVVFDD